MEEQELAFSPVSMGLYVGRLTEAFELVEGQTYTVNWDGTEYECVCSAFNSILVLGNLSIHGVGDDTGEPFVYVSVGEFTTLDTSASHTISVKTVGEVITPMAPDFLPQATQTTYGAIKKAAHVPNAAGDTPTAAEFNALLKSLRDAGILATS